jgi:hypothetical protein
MVDVDRNSGSTKDPDRYAPGSISTVSRRPTTRRPLIFRMGGDPKTVRGSGPKAGTWE